MSITSSSNFKIENSTLTNVHGNATIFKFDGGGPLTEEFRSLILQHMTGSITVQDLDKLENRILSQAISNIPRANAAYDEYSSEDQNRVACFEGTRCALLMEIGEWAVDPNGSLFYVLFGIAGVGKSTIAQTFAEKADVLRLLGASFFFSRDEADRKSAAKFFTTLAFQLCVFNERFAQAIGHVLSQDEGVAATTKGPLEQLNVLILGPLRGIIIPGSLPILVVVDALDECNEPDRMVILAGLNRLVQELPSFKVFLTTRPHPHPQSILQGGNRRTVSRLEDIEDKVVDNDIRVYLNHCLSQEQIRKCLPRLRRPWSPSNNDIESLVRAAGQLFIVASTSVRFILDPNARTPAPRMQNLLDASRQGLNPLKALNDFYTIILRSAIPEDCDEDILENYQAVIGAVIVIQMPLPIESLAELIDASEDGISAVLDNLQSVISLGNDDIPLIRHKSFSDYITDPERCRNDDLRITPKDHHTQMATCCLRAMNKYLKRNILGFGVSAQFLDNDQALKEEHISEDQFNEKIPAVVRYASVYWVMHIKEAEMNADVVEELRMFADEHLTHWLETLSLMGQLDKAPGFLRIVLKLLQSTPGDMHAIFFYALRLVSVSFRDIRRSALHTYHSALPFTPTKRPLYKKYKKEMTHEIGGVHEKWDAEIATVYTGGSDDYVARVVFSRDGSQFASRADYCVRVWDAISGTPVGVLEGGETAVADDFSVTASSQDRMVTLCSMATNAPIATFQHSGRVMAIALSSDGLQLAAKLDGGAISVWDVRKEEVIVTLPGLVVANAGVSDGYQLAFSPGGGRLASVSPQATELWDVANEKLVCRLNHKSSVLNFSFLRGASRFACADNSNTLTVWDAESGKSVRVIRCELGRFAISTDGSSLASPERRQVKVWGGDSLTLINIIRFEGEIAYGLALSKDLLAIGLYDTVELRDIGLHSLIATFKVPAGHSKFFAFSSDGTRLAGAERGCIRLWEVQRTRRPVLESKKQVEVSALAFSPDGSRLATGFKDGTVQLWDTTYPAHPISTQSLDGDSIRAVAFSPEGERFASRLKSSVTTRIWDGRDGSLIASFDPPDSKMIYGLLTISRHHLLAISHRLLAVAKEKRIYVWDHRASRAIHTLEFDSLALALSPDSSLLASAGSTPGSRLVTLWNVARGTRITTFEFPNCKLAWMLRFSPDTSKLAVGVRGALALVDVVQKEVDENPGQQDLPWVPDFSLIPDQVLRLPGHSHLTVSARESSGIFALGFYDGRVLIVRLSTPAN